MNEKQRQMPDEYTKTELKDIPKEWSIMKAKEVFVKIQDGTHFSPKLGGGDYLYLTSKNIRAGKLNLSSVEYIDEKQHKGIYKRCDVQKGDILLTKDGANTGNAALNILDEEFSLLSSVALLRVDSDINCAEYYLQQILSSSFQQTIQGEMSGNAITRLTLDKINNLEFLVPKIEEQVSIANALSDVDALITSLEKLIAKKRAIKTATMQQLLTGKKRLPPFDKKHTGYKQTELGEIPEDWEVVKFGSICTLINGRGFKPHEWSQNGLPIIRIQNLNGSDDFNFYDGDFDPKILVQHGQLLFAWSGSRGTSFGPHIWYGGDAVLNYHTWKLVVDNEMVDEGYFFHALKVLTKNIEDSAHGASALVHTQKGEMEKFDVILPSNKAEQAAIARVLSDLDKDIDSLMRRLTKTQQLKQGMMQELLTGRTRLA